MKFFVRYMQGVCLAKAESAEDLTQIEGWVEVSETEYLNTEIAPSEPNLAEPSVWDEMAAAYQKGVQES